MSDKELEEKLRWIFEAYGKDLQAFFRDAYAEGLNVRPALPKFTQYCSKCGEGHNKAVAYCLKPDCGGMMGERRHALRVVLKLERSMFKGVPVMFDDLTVLKSDDKQTITDLLVVAKTIKEYWEENFQGCFFCGFKEHKRTCSLNNAIVNAQKEFEGIKPSEEDLTSFSQYGTIQTSERSEDSELREDVQ